jgi:hypothetical protein
MFTEERTLSTPKVSALVLLISNALELLSLLTYTSRPVFLHEKGGRERGSFVSLLNLSHSLSLSF